jgi:cytochrome P450
MPAETTRNLPPRYDAYDPEVMADPYPAFARLRAAGPLCRIGPAMWGVTRYDDIARLLRDPRLGTSYPHEYHEFSAGSGPVSSFLDRIMPEQDPPEHTYQRRLLALAFRPGFVREMKDHVAEVVDEVLIPLLDVGRFDFVDDFAYPVPAMVWCRLLGIPAADREEVWPRVAALTRAFRTLVPEHERGPANDAVVWLLDYVGALVRERRARPGDDLLSRMALAEDEGRRLTDQQIADNATFMFAPGFEVLMNVLSTGCSALLRHPDQLAKLRDDPGLALSAVDEFLRYDSPIQITSRIARESIEIDGRVVKQGRLLIMLLGSGNHDEQVFVDPEGLDVERSPNPYLSFGGGIHYCLGGGLARVEAAAVFTQLLRRCAVVEAAGEPVRRPEANFRALAALRVAVKPAG